MTPRTFFFPYPPGYVPAPDPSLAQAMPYDVVQPGLLKRVAEALERLAEAVEGESSSTGAIEAENGSRGRPETLTAKQAAALLGVSVKTVYERARAKELPGVLRVGRVLRFSRTALLSWLESGQTGVARKR